LTHRTLRIALPLFVASLLAGPLLHADDAPAGFHPAEQYRARLITVEIGALPVILTVPHGGSEPIPGVPERTGENADKFTATRDVRTIELAQSLADAIEQELGSRPYTIAAGFSRKYLDVNRRAQDAFEDEDARGCYEAYHHAVRASVDDVHRRWKHGLLLDVHGQGQKPDMIWRGTEDGLAVRKLRDRHGWEPLTGLHGFFGVLADRGYPIFPAAPEDSERPLNGGYTLETYGSHQPRGIDAIQVEVGRDFRTNATIREKLARDLAAAANSVYRTYLIEAAP
jgi:N-formylglutamate amidohydrolase